MSEELKPCPFCGGQAILENKYDVLNRVSFIMCPECGARTIKFSISTEWSSDQKAIEAWNRRTEV